MASAISLTGLVTVECQDFHSQSRLYFSGSEQSTGRELFRTDGTAAGTVRLTNLNSGQDGFQVFLGFAGNDAIFLANDGTHGRLRDATKNTADTWLTPDT